MAGVRVASDEAGNFIFDPSIEQTRGAHLDLIVAGTEDAITMVEAQGKQADDALVMRALEYAHSLIRELCAVQRDFFEEYTRVYPIPNTPLLKRESHPETHTLVAPYMTQERL